MGHHNNIHDYNDEQFYFCTLHDCACGRRIDYYDTSNNDHTAPRHNGSRSNNNDGGGSVNNSVRNDNGS
jgi:hypothetical protein